MLYQILQDCPKVRLHDTAPFTVDFTGVLYVHCGEEEDKAYVCLFTWATTHAVHLKFFLSTATFLLAFWHFAGQKSLPNVVISENGSTYLSAAEDLHTFAVSIQEAGWVSGSARGHLEIYTIKGILVWRLGEQLIGLTKMVLKKGTCHRITLLPHQHVQADEMNDPTLGEESQLWGRAKLLALLL